MKKSEFLKREKTEEIPVLHKFVPGVLYFKYHDFEDLIEHHYGHRFCIMSTEEMSRDEDVFCFPDEKLDSWAEGYVQEFIETGNEDCGIKHLVTDMAMKGYIPKMPVVIHTE